MRCDLCPERIGLQELEIRAISASGSHLHLCQSCANVYDTPGLCKFIRYDMICKLPADHIGIHRL